MSILKGRLPRGGKSRSVAEGYKPVDQGVYNGAPASAIAMRMLVKALNDLLGKRRQTHLCFLGWPPPPGPLNFPDPGAPRVRLKTSPFATRLVVRIGFDAVQFDEPSAPVPHVRIKVTNVFGGAGTVWSSAQIVNNVRDAGPTPQALRWVEQAITAAELGFDPADKVLDLWLYQDDCPQLHSVTVHEATETFLDPVLFPLAPNADDFYVGGRIYDASLLRLFAALRLAYESQGAVLFSNGRPSSIGWGFTSATFVNVDDTAISAWDANGPGFWVEPTYHGKLNDDSVTCVFWVQLSVSDTGVPVGALWAQFTLLISGSTLVVLDVQDGFPARASTFPAATDKISFGISKRFKWSGASALGATKIDCHAQVLGTVGTGLGIYAYGVYEHEEFDPRSLPGLKVWLVADKITGLSDGAAVSTWNDASGSGNHATQGTGANQPVYKTGIISGMPVVRFDGVDDVLKIADSSGYKVAAPSIIVVARTTLNNANSKAMISYPHATTSTTPFYRWAIVPHADPTMDLYGNARTNSVTAAWKGYNSGQLGPARIWALSADTAAVKRDGQIMGALLAVQSVTYPNAVGIYIGTGAAGTDPWGGDIAEVLVYDRILTASEAVRVEQYLAEKYGLTYYGAGVVGAP